MDKTSETTSESTVRQRKVKEVATPVKELENEQEKEERKK